jgi:thiamine biosynthesis lipoprotein
MMPPLLGLFLALPLVADEPKLSRYEYTEPHMGTQFKIILYARDENQARKAAQTAFARIAFLDASMSDYRETSELMQLCKKAGGPPVPVSEELFVVLERAEQVSRLSDGAFDVTVGPVVRLWRLSRRTQRLPEPDKLARALALVGYQNVKLDANKRTVQLLKAGMQLDLGGIAKGYAGDEAQVVLKKNGITRALVAAGGDIVVSAPPPDAAGWNIAIAPLDPADGKPADMLLLHHAAVSTSGDANQYVEIEGKRYSHIVDPRTGLGLVGRMSVTVIAPKGIQSDSLTKMVCVLGPEKGLALLETQPGVSARMVRLGEKGQEVFRTKDFPVGKEK